MTGQGSLLSAGAVFAATLLATFFMAWLGRRRSGAGHDALADEKLNKWLVGLSAGAAANSGFIVTGAVGLGYVGGVRWLMLPLGWLLGDVVFWLIFPRRINKVGAQLRVTSLSELLTRGLGGPVALALSLVVALLVTACLSGYIAAQWLAGQKFLAGAFGIAPALSLGLFGLLIVSYTAIGGFRGSVYVDSLQAVIRILGTALALGAVSLVALRTPALGAHLQAAGPDFLSLGGGASVGAAVGVALGYGAAALGFGLGQPQIVSRYLAGASPAETQSAWWIYMGFVQFTWIAMTLFGVLLRGVMPGLHDPETGLSAFFGARAPAVLTGVIVADVFATIAATSNALLVAIGQTIAHDLGPRLLRRGAPLPLTPICLGVGLATMVGSLLINSTVVSLALGSVSLIGAGVAPAVIARVLDWPRTAGSMLCGVVAGVLATMLWRSVGLDQAVNEAAPGMAVGIGVSLVLGRALARRSRVASPGA